MSQNEYERMGGTYRQECGYLIPDVVPPETPKIGIWGMRRKRFLKTYKDPIYTGMLLSGTLNAHLEEIDKHAGEILDSIIKQLSDREGITEQLKAMDQLAWVRNMNAIQSQAEEIIYQEWIYT